MTSKEKALAICKLLSEKKGENIVYIDVAEKSSLCDYFVIAGGRSSTTVKALCDNLEEKMEKLYGERPSRYDGGREGRWNVLDYGDVIVHVFNDEMRDFYNLERLWENGENLTAYRD